MALPVQSARCGDGEFRQVTKCVLLQVSTSTRGKGEEDGRPPEVPGAAPHAGGLSAGIVTNSSDLPGWVLVLAFTLPTHPDSRTRPHIAGYSELQTVQPAALEEVDTSGLRPHHHAHPSVVGTSPEVR